MVGIQLTDFFLNVPTLSNQIQASNIPLIISPLVNCLTSVSAPGVLLLNIIHHRCKNTEPSKTTQLRLKNPCICVPLTQVMPQLFFLKCKIGETLYIPDAISMTDDMALRL